MARVAAGGARVLPARDDREYGSVGWIIDSEGIKVDLRQPPSGAAPFESA